VDGGEFLVRFQRGHEPGAASFGSVSPDSSVVSDCFRGCEDVDGQVGERSKMLLFQCREFSSFEFVHVPTVL